MNMSKLESLHSLYALLRRCWRPWPVLVALFVLGLCLRLPILKIPQSVVFDEVYFGKFATAYCCSFKNIFDIHPPHAKLIIAGTAKLFGHQDGFDFDRIGQPFDGNVEIVGLRLAPAVAGAFIPSLAALLSLQLGAGLLGAMFVGLLLSWDNGLWVQSRIIALDSILIAFILAALTATLAGLKRNDMRSRSGFLFLAGTAAGLAVGSKFTGLVTVPLIGLLVLISTLKDNGDHRWLDFLRQAVWILAGFVLIYLAGWWLHFHLLDPMGPGEAFYIPRGEFFRDLIALHKIMFEKNAGITTPHPYGSLWYTWPIMKRSVFYWNSSPGIVIYLLGNPVVWLGTLAAAVGFWFAPLRMDWREWTKILQRAWLPLLACVFSFLPFVGISRPLFLYHYFSTLVFSVVFVVLAWEPICQRLSQSWPAFALLRPIALILVVAGFIAMLPMTAGIDIGGAYRDWVFSYVPSWR